MCFACEKGARNSESNQGVIKRCIRMWCKYTKDADSMRLVVKRVAKIYLLIESR